MSLQSWGNGASILLDGDRVRKGRSSLLPCENKRRSARASGIPLPGWSEHTRASRSQRSSAEQTLNSSGDGGNDPLTHHRPVSRPPAGVAEG